MINWHPFNPSIKHQPYAHYDETAQTAKVFKAYGDVTFVLDYASVKMALSRSEPFHSFYPMFPARYELSACKRVISDFFMCKNGTDHKESRQLFAQAFSLSGIQQVIEEVTTDLIAELSKKEQFDVIETFTTPLPVRVISRMLGVPKEDMDLVKKWAAGLLWVFDVFVSSSTISDLEATSLELENYFKKLIQENRIAPGKNFLNTAIRNFNSNGRLSANDLEKIISFSALLIMTGVETTTSAMGNAIYSLLQNKKQLETLKADWTKMLMAVEELLRFESPLQFSVRMMSEDSILDGVAIKKGGLVFLCLGAANRDESKFSQPHQLNLSRKSNPHLAFAAGAHYCFGARLARMEMAIGLKSLFTAFPNLKLVSESSFAYKPYNYLKGFQHLYLSKGLDN